MQKLFLAPGGSSVQSQKPNDWLLKEKSYNSSKRTQAGRGLDFRRSFPVAVLLWLLMVLIALSCSQLAAAQTCYILPSTPVAVPSGGSYSFSATCGTGLSWTLTGPGTLTSNGFYYAPSSVTAQNQDRGCQVSPNNSPFNVPVDGLPVDPHSARWLARAAQDQPQYLEPYHNMKLYPGIVTFYSNVVNSNTPQQTMDFYYSQASYGYQGANFPIPLQRTSMMETGVNIDPSIAYDRHLLTMNPSTCQETEIYNLYADFDTVSFTPGNPTGVTWTTSTVWNIPQQYLIYISNATGAWGTANGSWRITLTGANAGTLPFDSSQWGPAPSGILMSALPDNCNNCNAQAGQKFSPTLYAQLGGVDAGGMPINSLSAKLEEWYAATQAGRSDLGHAVRTTMSNNYLSSRFIWPATSYAFQVAGTQIQLTGATNGNPTTFTAGSDLSQGLPCPNYTYTTGCQFNINISGIVSGPWTAANGDWVATAIDNYTFTIPLDSTQFGSFPGASMVFDFFPYGATIRLMASVDLDGLCTSNDLNNWCPYAKVYLNTIKKYGMIIADGTVPADNWDNGTMSSEFHPNVLLDAASNIEGWAGLQPIENYLEVVNRSSQQIYTDLGRYQDSNVNRTYVTVCGSYGCASDDILLQGTTIGTDHERLLVAAGLSYPLNVWVNGNVNTAISYAVSGISGATVSSGGLLTMPNCTVKQQGIVTVTSQADPNALPLYIEVGCLPVSSDGGYRLALGNYTGDYLDSQNFTWYGSWANYGFDSFYEAPGLIWGGQTGTWQGYGLCSNDTWTGTDSQLYSRSTSFNGDTKVEVALPNGNYNLTLYGEPGFAGFDFQNNTCPTTAGQNVYDWVVQGQTAGSWLDGYVLAGNQNWNGYTLSAPATVSDQVLDTIGRTRVVSAYGMSWSSLLISPATAQQLTITTSSLPHAYDRIPYIAHLAASYGYPPYTWSLASGSGPLPQGLTLTSSGLIFGTPMTFGTFPLTIEVTDSQLNTATKNLNLTVCSPGHLC